MTYQTHVSYCNHNQRSAETVLIASSAYQTLGTHYSLRQGVLVQVAQSSLGMLCGPLYSRLYPENILPKSGSEHDSHLQSASFFGRNVFTRLITRQWGIQKVSV